MQRLYFPSPDRLHPINLASGEVFEGTVFLANAIDHPRMDVGAYTYASAHRTPKDWAAHLAPYLYDFSPEFLRIGRFCQIADGVQFITVSANHRYDGISTFPFAVFDGSWDRTRPSVPQDGPDTVIGHDVWIGQGARVLPGAHVGNGVIVGAGAVVGGTVPDYTIVAGNPARMVRERVAARDAARLCAVKWWDWPIGKILTHEALICGTDIDELVRVAQL